MAFSSRESRFSDSLKTEAEKGLAEVRARASDMTAQVRLDAENIVA